MQNTVNDIATTLTRESNARVSISRLPSELLVAVFKLCAVEARWPFQVTVNTRIVKEAVRCWIRLAQVCHHWRSLALTTPSLWSTIFAFNDSHPDLVRQLLLRSKQTPLTLVLDDCSKHYRRDAFNELLGQLERIRILLISLNHRNVKDLEWPSCSAPSLKVLKIYLEGYQRRSSRRPHDTPFPHNISAIFPSLEVLSITNFQVDLHDWSLPPTITHLEISNKASPLFCKVADIISILRKLPSLRTLVLARTITMDEPGSVVADAVPLSHLQCLAVDGDPLILMPLLSSLSYPRTTRFALRFPFPQDSAQNDLRASAISTFLAALPEMAGMYISISEEDEFDIQCRVRVKAWRDVESIALADWRPSENTDDADLDILLYMSAEQDLELSDFIPVARSALAELPISCMRRLLLNCIDWKCDLFEAPSLYARMQNLQHLKVCTDDWNGRLRGSLGSHYDVAITLPILLQPDGCPSFPLLRTLHLQCMSFSAATMPSPFIDFLQEQQSRGQSLHLTLTHCYELSAEFVDRLRVVAASVNWDGLGVIRLNITDTAVSRFPWLNMRVVGSEWTGG